jgi:hypothetical protein
MEVVTSMYELTEAQFSSEGDYKTLVGSWALARTCNSTTQETEAGGS